ncbi:tetratricopeptide repeat protein [Elusimicrobiota bacterium]
MTKVKKVKKGFLFISSFLCAALFFVLCLGSVRSEEKVLPLASAIHYAGAVVYENAGEYDKALRELILAYRANPDAFEILEEIIPLSLELRQIDIAEIYSNYAMKMSPENPVSMMFKAQVFQARGNSQDALILLHQAHKLKPDDSNILLELSAIYAHINNSEAALRYLGQYLELNPRSPELLKIKGNYELESKNPEAIKTYRMAVELIPDDVEAIGGLVNAYKDFSTLEALKAVLTEMLSADPRNIEMRITLCNLEELSSQAACFEDILARDPTNKDALFGILSSIEQSGDWEEALDFIEENRGRLGKDSLYVLKKSYYMLKIGRLNEAVELLEGELGKDPENEEVAYFLALGYQDIGKFGKSRDILDGLYKKKPNWMELTYNLALVHGETGQNEKMEKMLEGLLKNYPEEAAIQNAFGFSLADNGKRLEEAQSLIEKALEQEPDNYYYQDSLAWVLFRKGDIPQARKMLLEILRHANDAEILLHFAQLERASKQDSSAWKTLWQARLAMAAKAYVSPRLGALAESIEGDLDEAKMPPRAVFLSSGLSALGNFSSVFKCDWKVKGGLRMRTRMALNKLNEDGLAIYLWPPGSMVPMSLREMSHNVPESSKLFNELEKVLKDFFRKGPINSAESKNVEWRIKKDFSVSAEGEHVDIRFHDFYSPHYQAVAPRLIDLRSKFLKASCESMGYSRE